MCNCIFNFIDVPVSFQQPWQRVYNSTQNRTIQEHDTSDYYSDRSSDRSSDYLQDDDYTCYTISESSFSYHGHRTRDRRYYERY